MHLTLHLAAGARPEIMYTGVDRILMSKQRNTRKAQKTKKRKEEKTKERQKERKEGRKEEVDR